MLQGVQETQIATVSYGEERPAAAGGEMYESCVVEEPPRRSRSASIEHLATGHQPGVPAEKRCALLFTALLAAGCVTEPQVDPVKLRLDDLDSRVGRIDRIVSNDSLVQMANRIEAQQQEIRLLHGQLERAAEREYQAAHGTARTCMPT